MNAQRIANLVKQLRAASDAYYNRRPVLTDAEYDALEDELRKADPNNAFLKRVGAPTSGAWTKVAHDIPMGSLIKVQDTSQLKGWYRKQGLQAGDDVVVSEKLDGISIALRYEGRKLVRGVTRGDGVTGEDITRNVMMMQGAVKMLPSKWSDGTPVPDLVFVRGEIICRKSDFGKHFKGESNPRNTASGTAKRQSNASKCRYLTIKAYQLLPNLDSKATELRQLGHAGFQVPYWHLCQDQSEVKAVYQEYVDTKRALLDYDIDGLVIELDDTSKRDALGMINRRPKGAVAFKFPHEQKPSFLRNIRWQVGNSGRVTPVAEFDVVNLAGANVKQASLHTVERVEKLKLFRGCRILVSRRNDVIPMVEANLDEGININQLD